MIKSIFTNSWITRQAKRLNPAMPACILLAASAFQTGLPNPAVLVCTLTVDKTVYKTGEVPNLQVEIWNKSNKDIRLIGSLDGSDTKGRMPYCYFTITKPRPDTLVVGRCGNMNPLRSEDFRLVKPGESFNPYGSSGEYGFFSDYLATLPETFKNPGVYKIQFHYSTNTKTLADFFGVPPGLEKADSLNILPLLREVPKLELASNEIEIRMEE